MSNERVIIGYRPHAGQIKLHNFLEDEKAKYFVINCGRQFGKTLWVINSCLAFCINVEPGQTPSNVWYVAPSYKLVKITYQKILRAITNEDGGFDKQIIKSINKTTFSVDFTNGSRLSLHSGEVPGNLRGDSITHLIYDEFAFASKQEELWNALQPATMVTGRVVIIISTPLGRNKFFELYQKGEDPTNPLYKSIKAPSWENPFFKKEELEEIKRSNPNGYLQEYCGEFLADAGTVFKFISEAVYDNNMSYNSYDPKKNYVMGVDLATKADFSVAIVIEAETKRVVDMFRINYTQWKFVIEQITNLYKKWNITTGYVEVNFNSRILEELVENGCKNLKPFTTGSQNKAQIIQNLQMLFENREIKIPEHPEMRRELEQFSMRFNPKSNKLFFSAPPGLHDDIPMAMALAASAIKEANKGKSTFLWAPL